MHGDWPKKSGYCNMNSELGMVCKPYLPKIDPVNPNGIILDAEGINMTFPVFPAKISLIGLLYLIS